MSDKQAFPYTEHHHDANGAWNDVHSGLTRRELFAAMAMQAIAAPAIEGCMAAGQDPEIGELAIAVAAVGLADALITELDK